MMRFDEIWIEEPQLEMTALLASYTNGLPGEAVEIGTWQGRSAIYIARAIAPATLHIVDHWRGDGPEAIALGQAIPAEALKRDNYQIFLDNMKDAGVDNFWVWKMDWREFVEKFYLKIRFLHLDADHTVSEVSDCLAATIPMAVDNAIFCGDDYDWPTVREGVHRHFPVVNKGKGKLWWTPIRPTPPGLVPGAQVPRKAS